MLTHFHRAWANSRKLIQCPAGLAGQVRTPQEQSDEEAQRQPQGRIAYEKDGSGSFSYSSSGKRSAWNGNQQTSLTTKIWL